MKKRVFDWYKKSDSNEWCMFISKAKETVRIFRLSLFFGMKFLLCAKK